MTGISRLYLACAAAVLAMPAMVQARDAYPGGHLVSRHTRASVNSSKNAAVREAPVMLEQQQRVVKKRQAPMSRVLENGVRLYGWLGYSDEDVAEGLYEFSSGGHTMLWQDPDFTMMSNGWEMGASWLSADGTKICGYSTDSYYMNIYEGAYVELDFETGEQLRKDSYDIYEEPIFNVAALNTSDGYIYGFAFDVDGNPVYLRANSMTPTEFETVRKFQSGDYLLCSLAYCPADGLMYAVTSKGTLVAYDNQFKATEIMSLNVPGFKSFITGMCYSDMDNRLYWNSNAANPNDPNTYISRIQAIDVAKKTMEEVVQMSASEEFMALYAPESLVEDDAPLAAEYVSNGFVNGALDGTVTFRMPSVTGDGTQITAQMSWTATVDGENKVTGTASAGELVEVPFSGLEEGNRQFAFVAQLGDKVAKVAKVRLYVGNDIPLAPTNVTISPDNVSWDAVTEGVNDGFVDPQAVRYEVFVNGESKGMFDTNSADIEVAPAGAFFAAYRATVTAVFADKRSASASSAKLLTGTPFELDLNIRPTAEQAELCTIIDGNNDGQSWVLYDESDDKFFNSQFSLNGDADDYIILPAVNFPDADAYYEISLLARSRRSAQFPNEFIDVRIGRTPEVAAMDKVIVEKTRCTDAFEKVQTLFKVEESGTWFVAIRCCSGFDQYGIYVKEINLSRAVVTNESPEEPTEIECVAGEQGALKSKVSFRLPTKRMNGSDIAADVTLTATVKSRNSVEVSGAPGEVVTAEVETVQGNNTVYVYVSDGSLVGPTVETTVYTGVVVPGLARNVKAKVQENNLMVDIEWEAPLVGQDGGYIVPEDVYYEIYLYGPAGWMRQASVGADVRTYCFEATDLEGGMAIVQLGVRCINLAGANPMVSIGSAIIGYPYGLPSEETYDRSSFGEYNGPDLGPSMMLAPDDRYTAEWGYSRLAEMTAGWSGLEGGALVCDPKGNASRGRIALPKVSTKVEENQDVVFSLRTYVGSDCAKSANVYVDSYDLDEPMLLADLMKDNRFGEWADKEIILPEELVGRTWIQPIIDVELSNQNQLFILDCYKFYSQDKSSVVEASLGGVKVTAAKGGITVSGANGEVVSVYTVSGVCVVKSESPYIALTPGMYLVKVAGKTFKVVVG